MTTTKQNTNQNLFEEIRAPYEVYDNTGIHVQILQHTETKRFYYDLLDGSHGESLSDNDSSYHTESAAMQAGHNEARNFWISQMMDSYDGKDYDLDDFIAKVKAEIARLAKNYTAADHVGTYRGVAESAIRQAEATIAILHEQGLPLY